MAKVKTIAIKELHVDIQQCVICASKLPLPPKPIVQFSASSKILIAGQAPGKVTHEKGIPFDDASGNRLRQWLGIDRDVFYDASRIAIVPMGFCFPGTGKSGDLAPRKECAEHWRTRVLEMLGDLELTLVIGQYAQTWHLDVARKASLTQIVSNWRSYWPNIIPLPHPSPRNNIWLKKNPWFEQALLPQLKRRVQELI